MAFIEKSDPIVLNIKLTSKGRELLSRGQLDFKYFAIGDSEIDYEFNAEVNTVDSEYTAFGSTILKPADKNPAIISFIPRNLSGDPYNLMTNVPISTYNIENQIESIGFFDNDGTTFITDSNHVKQPDVMIDVSMVAGGFNVTLLKTATYGTSGAEPAVGDILFVKWTTGIDTTGANVTKTYPMPNLFYKITNINTGTLAGSGVEVSVDRELPDFSALGVSTLAGAMILYDQLNFSGGNVVNYTPTEYLDESVLSFFENSQCPTIVFPFWNLTIIHTEEIAGVLPANLKYTQFKNRSFGGFVSYIQNQAPIYKRLGVIHYTNNSPANVYGEGFSLKTAVLEIPTIMYHKSISKTLGLKLVAGGSLKYLTGATKSLNLGYYDLYDINDTLLSYPLGKVFNDLKIFVIEDQELLFALSYKSNRSWTLPNYAISK
jgi:hypothetical protein